jgi:hypothetical protein
VLWFSSDAAAQHIRSAVDATWGRTITVLPAQMTQRIAVRVNRVEFIDVARGLFISWMIVGHSLSLTGVPWEHPLNLLRPRGWATYCFVMLAGLSLAVLYNGRTRVKPVSAKRLWRRALEIGLIAFLSNVFSRVVTSSFSGDLGLSFVLDVMLFRNQWTISGILLVPMFLLFLAPMLLWCAERVRSLTYFLAVSTVVAGIDLFVESHWFMHIPIPIQESLIGGGLFFFPVVTLVLYSIWSFSLANLATQLLRANGWFRGAWLLVVLLSACFGITILSGGELRSFGCFGHFLIAIGLSLVVSQIAAFAPLRDTLGSLGRVGLLIFILHRPILHLVFCGGNENFAAETLAVLMMTFALGLGLLMGLHRDRHARFSHALRLLGF